MKIVRLLLGSFLVAGTQLHSPSWASDAADVKQILSNIPVFVPVTADGKIKQLKREVDKKSVDVVFAAMSPAAASLLVDQVIRPAEGKGANDITLTVMPITQFRESFAAIKAEATGPVEMAYVPDPIQEGPAVSLMTSQGVKRDVAVNIARFQPIFFCPEPLLTVTQKVANQDRTFSPCGQDYVQMSLLVLGSNIKGSRPGLQAVPLAALEESLLSQPAEKIKSVLLLPSAATEQALQNNSKGSGVETRGSGRK